MAGDDLLGEYRAVIESYVQMAARRQTINSVYVGLNVLVLTALGALLVSSRLDTWWPTAYAAVLSIAILPLNWSWQRILKHFQAMINVHFSYLREIEGEFRPSGTTGQPGTPQAPGGLYNRLEAAARAGHFGTTQHERRLAFYFLTLYPLVCILVAVVTYLIQIQLIPLPPTIPLPTMTR